MDVSPLLVLTTIMLLKGQANVAPQRGLPVDDKGSASSIISVTGETVQFYYSNSGVLTTDAGQAAGVAVVAQLAYNNIKNALGNLEATKNDTSLSFTSTAFTSEVEVDWETIENLDQTTFANRLASITSGFTNGQYTVDYASGTLYGVKATTQTSLASAAYKILQGVSSGTGGTVSVTAIVPGTGATQLGKAEDAAHASGDVGVEMLAVRTDTPANRSGADGDYEPLQVSAGRLWTSSSVTAVVPGTAATSLGKAEDAAHTSGDVGVMALGVGNEAQSALAADGDYIPQAVDTKGNTLVVGNVASAATDAGNPVKIGGKYATSAPTLTNGQRGDVQLDVNANLKSVEQYAPGYEDNANNKAIVEHRYSYARVTADGQVKASAGFIHTVTLSPTTATPTAGLVTIYDNTAGSGTIVFSEWFFATDVAHTVILDVSCATGIYVEYDAAVTNMSVTVSYR